MEHLIESVRKYPCLWQMDIPEYKDNELKEAAWLEVFNECDFSSVTEMKSLWKKLRDGHRQAINAKKKTTTGQAADHKSAWKYEKHMEFLLPFMKNRTTHTNVTRNQQPEDSLTGEDSQDSSSEVNRKRNRTIYSMLEEEQKRREKRHEDRDLLRKQLMENIPKYENKSSALEKFFLSMFDTTSQLPEYLQISVQRKVFNIIMEAKEQHLMRSNSTQGSSGSIIYNFTGGTPFQLQRTSPFNPAKDSASSSYTSPDPHYSPEMLQTPPTPYSRHYEDCSQNVDSTARQYTDTPVQYSIRPHPASSSFITPGPVYSTERMTSPPRQQPPQQSTRPHSANSRYASPDPPYSPETMTSPPRQQPPQQSTRPHSANSRYASPDPPYSPETMTSPPQEQPPQQSTRPHSASSSYASPDAVYSPETMASPPRQQPPQSQTTDLDVRSFLKDFNY